MTTEKQMREILNSVWFHFEGLRDAIYKAENKKILASNQTYDDSIHAFLDSVKLKFENGTEKEIAKIIHQAIRQKHF